MEIELRAKIKNAAKIKKKLKEMGAKYLGVKMEKDQYFSSQQLCKKLGYSFLVRIRKRRKENILTVKAAKIKLDGVWEEVETKIKEPKVFIEMFSLIGLERVINIEKKRESFQLGKIRINLDKFKKWGNFIEAEIISRDKEDKKKLFSFFEKLGIKRENIIEKGYITIFLKEIKSPFAKFIKN
jgi:predicted adenylyl cyclase CyaB